MNKAIKIIVGVMVVLGLVSVIFLVVFKKKSATVATSASKTQNQNLPIGTGTGVNVPTNANSSAANAQVNQAKPPAPAHAVSSNPTATLPVLNSGIKTKNALLTTQWQQCKGKTMAANTNFLWNVQINEGIPAGGTYAKGNLNGDATLPVRVIISANSTIKDKISQMLAVGKTAFLRGTCTGVATDGSVILQAF